MSTNIGTANEMTRPSSSRSLLVIVGPNASGKSALALRLAKLAQSKPFQKRWGVSGAEIISADSRQVYKGLAIGSGRVPGQWLRSREGRTNPRDKEGAKNFVCRGVVHHLLDVANPQRKFTVAQFQKLARVALRKIVRQGKLPIIAGGTGLYVEALIYDQNFPAIRPDWKLRRGLENKSAADLFAELQRLDPRRAANIDRHNKRRLIRALEIVRGSGQPVPLPSSKIYSDVLENIGVDQVVKIGLNPPREKLNKKIDLRLRVWLRQGLLKEIQKLRREGLSWPRLEEFGLEYKWASRYLRGIISKEEMLRYSAKDIRAYAKRQMTWFKRDPEIKWLPDVKSAEKFARRLLQKS